ncbi:hypothetical protein AB0C77_37525 [Streptomyces sp. NPDC048629]|uniref:hypothetical protein n=1 Tax=Streptomyces sp. NPDC048629 TaxID=3154824 RepID=UPI003426CF55
MTVSIDADLPEGVLGRAGCGTCDDPVDWPADSTVAGVTGFKGWGWGWGWGCDCGCGEAWTGVSGT